ncbi:MAG: hypothetical protein ACM3UY_06690 [Methanocella sp.]
MRKYVALLLIAILAISSLMIIRPASSEITKPSTPEFTIQYVAHPYDVPTTYSIDPYTGQTITHPGYHVENKTCVLVIKNQPFTPYVSNGSEVQVYYQVRYKGHFSDNDWYEVYHLPNYPVQSDSEYTTISPTLNIQSLSASTDGAKIDFQVQALIGSIYLVEARLYGGANYWTFEGEKSDWSSTQTITVELPDPSSSALSPTPTASVLPSQNPISTPDQSGPQTVVFLSLDWTQIAIVALLGIIAVLLVAVVVFLHKRSVNTTRK